MIPTAPESAPLFSDERVRYSEPPMEPTQSQPASPLSLLLRRGLQVFAALYFISAGLQYNDPDPLTWALIYSTAGGAMLLHPGSRWSRLACSLVAGVALCWALTLLPEARGVGLAEMTESMQAHGGSVEIAREAGGLFLVVAGMGAGLFVDLRARSGRT